MDKSGKRCALALMLLWVCVSSVMATGGHANGDEVGTGPSLVAPEAVEGAPTLRRVRDAGGATVHLTWSNSAEAPSRFLGLAYDIYADNWVLGGEGGSPWHPFDAVASSGDMTLGAYGAYHVWISNQYAGGWWYPCPNPWTGIVHSGTPHTPINAINQLRYWASNLRLWWKPDLYGTWCYQIIAYKEGEGWVETSGPSGLSLWHVVDYGGEGYYPGQADFLQGWADFWLPAGSYWFFIRSVGWRPPFPQSSYATTHGVVPEEISFSLPGNVPLVMRPISPGSFQMGSPDTEWGRWIHESPVRAVSIGYSFYLGKHEVTQEQWQAVMGSNPAHNFGVGDEYPVYYVSWDDCQSFVSTLNGLGLGGTFRLPSESEWEYACRAGTTTRFFFGDSLSAGGRDDAPAGTLPGNRSDYMWSYLNRYENTNGQYGYGSHPVGTKLPNAWGLFDMSGNVGEWCQDWYHTSYDGAPSDGSAWDTQQSGYRYRVNRGGDWDSHATSDFCRSASREYDTPEPPHEFIGLRVVWTPD